MLDIGLVLFSTWLWTETELRSVNIQKVLGQHLAMLNKLWLIKYLLY